MAFLVQDGGMAKGSYMQQLRDNYDSELARRWTAAEQLARTKFIADMNHQLRTPVNSVVGMTALLLDENLERRPLELATIIRDSGNALLELIENTPGSIKAEPTEAKIEGTNYKLRENVAQIFEKFRTRAKGRGIEFMAQLEDLPESVSFFDDNYLEQVLVNLLRNAVENTERGSITLSASCEELENGVMRIEFAIADTGAGIPASELDSVFNPFVPSVAKPGGRFGGGLGLPMSRGLTELMGGKIWIESSEGQGTTVRFTVRVQVEAGDASWQTARSIIGESHSEFPSDLGEKYPLKILVVEDHAINRRVLCQLLNKMGYQVDEAVDGQEAVAAAMNSAYDLMFMDLRMPNMGGIEATRWIREHYDDKNLSIVALTGEATEESRDRCLSAGMNAFLAKPIQLKALKAVLQQTGGKKSLENTDMDSG
jgi:CheY-like chemotaxis protein